MSAPTGDEKRFVNFPLFMLSKTIADPGCGIQDIFSFAIASYAEHCRPDAQLALIQALYVRSQRPSETLPDDVVAILAREDVNNVVDAVSEGFIGTDGDGSEFIAFCREMLTNEDICLSGSEGESLRRWCALRRSASYFKRTINSYDGIEHVYERVTDDMAEHELEYGPTVWASVPADYAGEVAKHGRGMDLFRCVAACRSIIGRHKFTGTTKQCIRHRMIGAKNQSNADTLIQDDAIRHEYERLKTRYQFDKTIDFIDRECRGFITKIGCARRIWLSTQATSHKELAGYVKEHCDLQNIAKQAQEGKALSSAQMKRLDEAATETSGGEGKMLRVEPCHVGQDQLSQILGITDRRIRQLAGQGIITKVTRGHYPFPGVIAEYCEYLRSGGEKDTSKLKERELELKCKRLEQTISEYDMARRDDIEADCWNEVADILAEYKSFIERMPVTDEQRDKMNELLAEAVERVETRRANQNMPDAQSEK